AIQAADTDTAVDTCAAGNGADRIVIPEGTYQLVGGGDENANVSGDLDIQTEVSREGAGASRTSLLGSGSDRVLHTLPGSKVTLRDLRVTGGRTLIGGGIYNAGQLNLINVLVDGNQASHGGGIASFGPLSLTGSQLVDNTAQGERGENGNASGSSGMRGGGGGGGGLGGGLYQQNASTTIVESVLTGNVARGGDGGHASGSDRTAAGKGGRIGGGDSLARYDGMPATAPGGGGGGAGGNSTGQWTNSSGGAGALGGGRGGNSVHFVSSNGGGGGGAGLGGAIFISGGSLLLHSAVVSANLAEGGRGGNRACSNWNSCGTHGESGIGSGGGIFSRDVGG